MSGEAKKGEELGKLGAEQILTSFDKAVASTDTPANIGLSGLMLGVMGFLIVAMLVAVGMKVVRQNFPGSSKEDDETLWRFKEGLGLFIIAFVMVLIFIYSVTIG